MQGLSFLSVCLIGLLLIAVQLNAQESRPSSGIVTGATRSPTPKPGSTTQRIPTHKQECTKQPPNFRELSLPCGGYDRAGCQKLCQNLKYPKFYCRKEEFCLCHSGDLYSC